MATGNTAWYRLTKFFGKLFLINFAIGVATGIVQEFQFGMNWSEYSRFVGDIFGAPLAMEGLAAFFFESTFLGLWIFGWSRLPRAGPPRLHLDRRDRGQRVRVLHHRGELVHAASGRRALQPGDRRAELDSIVALLTNNTALAAFSHAVTGSLLTAGTFVAAVSAWWLVRSHRPAPTQPVDARTHVPPGGHPGMLGRAGRRRRPVLHRRPQGKLMFHQQPMKMASAESLCDTETDPDFSILTVGTHNNCDSVTRVIEVPYVLPFLAEGRFSGVTLQGVRNIQQDYEQRFGARRLPAQPVRHLLVVPRDDRLPGRSRCCSRWPRCG